MPTERFNRLSEDKKKVIRDAAVKEFIRVPFEKASINQIIQNAGISRGSFYTYFEDKRDLLSYLFQYSAVKLRTFCEDSLEQTGGNLWAALEMLLEYCMDEAEKRDMFQLSRNVMMYQDIDQILGGGACSHEQAANDLLMSLFEKTDKSGFRNQTIDQFRQFLELTVSAMLMELNLYYKQPGHAESIKKSFGKKLEVMQHGICIS